MQHTHSHNHPWVCLVPEKVLDKANGLAVGLIDLEYIFSVGIQYQGNVRPNTMLSGRI